MRRKMLALAVSMLMLLGGCTNLQHYYERAQIYLGGGDYEAAARMFDELGGYADAADYALYCRGLAALAAGDLALARADLSEVEPLAGSSRYLRYIDAVELEQAGRPDEALALYEALGSFHDSIRQAEALRTRMSDAAKMQARELMSQGDYAAAADILAPLPESAGAGALLEACRRQTANAAYAAAERMAQAGELAGAAAAFDALGDTLDAVRRAAQCREELYALAERAYQHITLASATDLMADYTALGNYRQSEQRAAALEARFGTVLRLIGRKDEHPWVRLGTFMGRQVTWRVLDATTDTVTLLADRVLAQAGPEALEDLQLLAEDGTPIACRLPGFAELGSMDGTMRRCGAAEQEASPADAEGLTAWWLNDVTPDGTRLMVRGGLLTVCTTAEEAGLAGLRPVAEIPVDQLDLTEGDGSEEDPFR